MPLPSGRQFLLNNQGVSNGVFSGQLWAQKDLGSLSDGWVCVPTLLVVWLEVSQHWSLQAVGWDRS